MQSVWNPFFKVLESTPSLSKVIFYSSTIQKFKQKTTQLNSWYFAKGRGLIAFMQKIYLQLEYRLPSPKCKTGANKKTTHKLRRYVTSCEILLQPSYIYRFWIRSCIKNPNNWHFRSFLKKYCDNLAVYCTVVLVLWSLS